MRTRPVVNVPRRLCCLVAVATLGSAGLVVVGLPPSLLGVTTSDSLPHDALALPVLSQVGVIPVQIESEQASSGGVLGLERAVAYLEDEFAAAVREQGRFQFVSDDLVKAMWQTPALRAELKDDYELTAFFHLTVSPRQDSVVLVARLLGPNLEPYLQEELTVARQSFAAAERSDVRQLCSGLLAQLINRLPLDVSVSSVQGSYVTLTGGSQQGVELGETLTLERVWVVDRHPALKTWRSFKRQRVGQAKVIEVSEQVAIAEILQLVREDDIAAGDGSRVASLASRLRFARSVQDTSALAASDTIIVAPLYGPDSARRPQATSASRGPAGGSSSPAPQAGELPPAGPALAQAEGLAADDSVDPASSDTGQGAAGSGDEAPDAPAATAASPRTPAASRLVLHAGQRGWSYLGPGSTGSRVSWYIPFNQLGVAYEESLAAHISYRVGGELQLGKTHSGRSHYSGYNAHGRLAWQDELSLGGGLVEQWQVGVASELAGLAVASGAFGGYDLLYGGVFGSLAGRLPELAAGLGPLTWFSELHITPLTFGRLGYDDAHHSLRSSFGWQWRVGVWQQTPVHSPAWGLAFTYASQLFLDNSAESTALSQYSLAAMLRWPLQPL